MEIRDLEKCESDLIDQGFDWDEAKRLCEQEKDFEKKDQSDFDYPE